MVLAVAAALVAPFAFAVDPALAAAEPRPITVDGMNIDSKGRAVINGLERNEVAPGLVHVKYERLDALGWQQINVLKARLSDDTVKLKYLTPKTVSGPGATVTEMVDGAGAIAGVNLDRFHINNSWAAAGWGVSDGKIIKSGNPDAAASVGMTSEGLGALVDLVLQGSATFGNSVSVPIGGINVFAHDQQTAALFNSQWGEFSRAVGIENGSGIEVWVDADGKVSKAAGPAAAGAIPDGVQILVAKQSTDAAAKLSTLAVGDEVAIEYRMRDDSLDIQEAGGAWFRLLREGVPVSHTSDEYFTSQHPRTLIGFSKDRKTAYFVVVDGRTAIARGMNFAELSELMLELGAYDAINADGGGSSQMNVRHPGKEKTTIENLPSDLYERHDGDGMGLVLARPGSGELTGFSVTPRIEDADGLRVFAGLHRTLEGHGHDEQNSPVTGSPERWASNQPAIATVSDGVVAGKSSGSAQVTAARGIARGAADVEVLGKLDSLSLNQSVVNLEAKGASTVLTLTGHDVEGFTAPVEAADVEVRNPNPEVLQVEPTRDGRFRITAIGDKGSAVIQFRRGDVVAEVSVSVPLEVKVIDDFTDISGWTTAHDRAPTGSVEQGGGHEGSPSIKLNYNFTESTATRGRYAVAPGAVPGGNGGIDIPGRPQKLSVWIKGDGKGSLLRLQVMQSNGVRNWIDGPDGNQSLKTTWTGWERKDFLVPATFAFPLKLERIRVLETVASKQYKGSLEFSKIYAYLPPEGAAAPRIERVEDPIVTEATGTDGAPLRVAVMSDAQFVGREPDSAQVRGARETLREIVAAKPDLMIINGDFVDEAADVDFQLAKRILDEELQEATFPWYYVPGNHEVMGNPISKFESYFGPAKRTFDRNHTRFITVNSSSLKLSSDFSQVKMIREQLDEAKNDPAITGVVLVSHVPTNDPLPSKASQISDRREAALLDDWVQEFRSESGKSIAYLGGHVGVFHSTRVDGVPYVINGNSGKDPAAAPENGGFTGWTMLGIRPEDGKWQNAAPSSSGSAWLGVEVKPRIETVNINAPTSTLTAGETVSLKPRIVQTDAGMTGGAADPREVPVAWPISYTWSGTNGLYVGEARQAPASAIAALDPETSVLTALRAGSGSASLLVNGELRTVPVSVAGGEGSIEGEPVYGRELTAKLGAWADGAQVAYQWLRDGVAISGASAASYTLGITDLGSTMSARMTVRAEGRATVEVSASAGSPVALATQTAPELKLAGKAYLGSMLAVNAGEWPEGTRLTYQWLREGEEVVGAVSSGYALVAADLGQRIQVRVTGHRSGYADAVAISGKSAPVAKAAGNGGDPDVPEVVPAGELSILGSTTVGKTLTLRTTGWSSGVVLAPQWYRNGSAIPGASNSSYTLSAADLAARISVRVIAAKPGLVSIEMRGSVGSTVRPGVVPRFSSPTISGAVKAGRVVTAKLAKVPAGAKVKYAWLLDGKVVKNAKSYRVRTADVGKTLKLRVTVTKPGYTPQSKASAAKRVQSR